MNSAPITPHHCGRDGRDGDRPKRSPLQMARTKKLERDQCRDEDVQDQGRGLDRGGSKSEQRHRRDVPGRSGLAYAGVEDGNQEKGRTKKGDDGRTHERSGKGDVVATEGFKGIGL